MDPLQCLRQSLSRDMSDLSPPSTEFSGSTVLVTGGAGFIGSHIADALVPNNDVRILDNGSTGSISNVPEEADVIHADVTDQDAVDRAMDGVDIAFHQAAVVSVEESVSDPITSHRVNVDGTLAVLQAARREDARVVYASSAAIYGDPAGAVVSEGDETDPQSPYGVDKLAADAYARTYASVYDLPVVVLRYFNVYGPRQRGPYSGVVDAFFERALDQEPLLIHGDGEQTRDFVHVYDVVRANLAAATTEHVGQAFNIGTGNSVTIRELADAVGTALGVDIEVAREPPREGDIRHSRTSTDRLRRLLEVDPSVSLKDGLRHLANHRTDGQSRETSDGVVELTSGNPTDE